jgi:epoxyqueuosine reductase
MAWMLDRADLRRDPTRLLPGVRRIISLRMDYFPPKTAAAEAVLSDPTAAYISRYALGRDYHKLLRRRIQQLADRIAGRVGPFGYRAFTDSAPVLEKALAEQAGLGWIGKHTNLLSREAGSWFFLGELFTDLPLPIDQPIGSHCGHCSACLDICPTAAFRGPYDLDARRCISYLTIEHRGSIPEALRPLLGNRIYGCDDCQLVCPWNRFAKVTVEPDFIARHGLDAASLLMLFGWEEQEFLARTAGMAIRRIGHERWLRNIAVALGNGPATPDAIAALERRAQHPSALVREHVGWALNRLLNARIPTSDG